MEEIKIQSGGKKAALPIGQAYIVSKDKKKNGEGAAAMQFDEGAGGNDSDEDFSSSSSSSNANDESLPSIRVSDSSNG